MNELFEKDNELHYHISIKFEAIENGKTIDEYESYAKINKDLTLDVRGSFCDEVTGVVNDEIVNKIFANYTAKKITE